jgi:hypothetical protein
MLTYLGTGVSISSIQFKGVNFIGAHFICVSNDVMPRRVRIGQAPNQPQDLGGVAA